MTSMTMYDSWTAPTMLSMWRERASKRARAVRGASKWVGVTDPTVPVLCPPVVSACAIFAAVVWPAHDPSEGPPQGRPRRELPEPGCRPRAAVLARPALLGDVAEFARRLSGHRHPSPARWRRSSAAPRAPRPRASAPPRPAKPSPRWKPQGRPRDPRASAPAGPRHPPPGALPPAPPRPPPRGRPQNPPTRPPSRPVRVALPDLAAPASPPRRNPTRPATA